MMNKGEIKLYLVGAILAPFIIASGIVMMVAFVVHQMFLNPLLDLLQRYKPEVFEQIKEEIGRIMDSFK